MWAKASAFVRFKGTKLAFHDTDIHFSKTSISTHEKTAVSTTEGYVASHLSTTLSDKLHVGQMLLWPEYNSIFLVQVMAQKVMEATHYL